MEQKHSDDITNLATTHSGDIDAMKSQHDSDISMVRNEMDNMKIAPLGTILAWTPKPSKSSGNVSAIPDCWIPCDGSTIKEGMWNGDTIPNLNGENR